MFSRDYPRDARAPDCALEEFESLQLQFLLSVLYILKRDDYFSLSPEGRCDIGNRRCHTDIVAGLKVSFLGLLWVTSEFVHTWVSTAFKFCVGLCLFFFEWEEIKHKALRFVYVGCN